MVIPPNLHQRLKSSKKRFQLGPKSQVFILLFLNLASDLAPALPPTLPQLAVIQVVPRSNFPAEVAFSRHCVLCNWGALGNWLLTLAAKLVGEFARPEIRAGERARDGIEPPQGLASALMSETREGNIAPSKILFPDILSADLC